MEAERGEPGEEAWEVQDLARGAVRALSAYVPGKQPEGHGWIKLNTNENPYAPSETVGRAVAREVERLRFYPNPTSGPLRSALAAHHGVEPDEVLVGNGSDDVLNLLMRVFADESNPIGFTVPSYSLYPVLAGIQGAPCREVAFGEDMDLPFDEILACGARLFFLTAPNAPTGVGFAREVIRDLVAGFEGVMVLDEAYADFASYSGVPWVVDFPNLVVTRSFSKSYGLAGLRVGYAIAQRGTIDLLDRVRDSYNVNALSQAGALAALADREWFARSCRLIRQERARAERQFRDWGWFTYPSETNFLLTRPQRAGGSPSPEVARSLWEFLEENRILVRYFGKDPLTCETVRISVGRQEEMDHLFEAIERWRKLA